MTGTAEYGRSPERGRPSWAAADGRTARTARTAAEGPSPDAADASGAPDAPAPGRPDAPAPGGPGTFALRGRTWDRLPGVPAPPHSRSTGVAMRMLGFGDPLTAPRSGSFLEVGSGTGVIAVSAALAGCHRVVGTDTSPRAVRNTALNAARHGVADRVRAVEGDFFSGLGADERFSTVYWHSASGPGPAGYRQAHGRATDPGYAAHRRYLTEAPRWTVPGGAALLHFSDRGDVPGLWNLAESCGRDLRVLRSRRVREGVGMVEHLLFEITVAAAPVPRRDGAARTAAPTQAPRSAPGTGPRSAPGTATLPRS